MSPLPQRDERKPFDPCGPGLVRSRRGPRGLRRRAGLAGGLLLAILASAAPPARADDGAGAVPTSQPNGSADVSGEELMLFKEMPAVVVVSAARQAQPANWSSVSISVLTAEDIHHSGVTNIPELLRFVPGVDVARLDRNIYAVGVRGLHERYADRMLTLIDGRVATSPAFGGTEWLSLPILMEDIKRIEVIRGPCGAAWGADAMTGAVNIITKEPEETAGWMATTWWDTFGDSYNALRWGHKAGNWAVRTSLGFSNLRSSEVAIHGDDFRSQDTARRIVFDGKAAYRPSEDIRVTFGLAGVHEKTGSPDVLGTFPGRHSWYRSIEAFTKVDRKFDKDRNGYLQWRGQYTDVGLPLLLSYQTVTNELEAQYNFVPARHHKASVGGNLRWLNFNRVAATSGDFATPGDPFNEYWVGLFAIDRWQVAKRLAIEAQGRGEYYSGTHADWAGRLTGLYSLDEAGNHILRLSGAKGYRSPLLAVRRSEGTVMPLPSPPLPPGLFGVNVFPHHGLKNEETWAIEAGYTGKLYGPLTLRADAYYQRYENLIGSVNLPDPLSLGRVFNRLENIAGADSWGGEVELAAHSKSARGSIWYAYNDFRADHGKNQDMRVYRPAPHKFGLSGRLFLPNDWTLNANYRFSAAASGETIARPSIGRMHQLDMNVAKKLGDHMELRVGVNDLLNSTDESVLGTSKIVEHTTPGRTLFVQLQVQF